MGIYRKMKNRELGTKTQLSLTGVHYLNGPNSAIGAQLHYYSHTKLQTDFSPFYSHDVYQSV